MAECGATLVCVPSVMSLYLEHAESKGPVQVAVRLHHCFTVTAFKIDSGDASHLLIGPVQKLARSIYSRRRMKKETRQT